MGISMGGYAAWSCLKYIPQRLLGVSSVVPFVHYWWPSFPHHLSTKAFQKLPVPDQWTFRVAHYAPWLLHWWMTQKWFTSLSIMAGNMDIFSRSDHEVLKKFMENPDPNEEKALQQGIHESLVRDVIAGYAKWEFGPLSLENPFPDGQGSVHIWQGYEDGIIPFELNRYVCERLPWIWIQYHEIPDKGHLMFFDSHICESILRELLLSGHP